MNAHEEICISWAKTKILSNTSRSKVSPFPLENIFTVESHFHEALIEVSAHRHESANSWTVHGKSEQIATFERMSQYFSVKETSVRVLWIWRCSIEIEAREWFHDVAWNIRNTFTIFRYSPKRRFQKQIKLASNAIVSFLALSNSANLDISGYSYRSLCFQVVKRTNFVLPFNIF